MFVYIWKKPDGTPFYVGLTKHVGRTNPLNSGGRGWLCKQTLEAVGRENTIVEIHITPNKEEGVQLERQLIAKYGRIQLATGTNTNLNPGGDGTGGMSDKGKESLRRHMLVYNPAKRPEVRAKIKSRMQSPEMRAKVMGEKNPAKRPEVREKLKALWATPEFRERMHNSRTGKKKHTDAFKERARQRLLNPDNPLRKAHEVLNSDPDIKQRRETALKSPEVRAKISAALKESWARRKRTI